MNTKTVSAQGKNTAGVLGQGAEALQLATRKYVLQSNPEERACDSPCRSIGCSKDLHICAEPGCQSVSHRLGDHGRW